MHDDHELLAKERQVVQQLVRRSHRRGIDGDFQFAGKQPLLEVRGGGIQQLERHTRVPRSYGAQEIEQQIGRDGAHQAKPQRRLLQANEVLRMLLGALGAFMDLFKIGQHGAAELGKMCVGALTVK